MIKVSILKNGVFSFGATFTTQEAADDYIGIESTKGSFGKIQSPQAIAINTNNFMSISKI